MRELSLRIDASPNEEDIKELAEARIRQNMVFEELKSYNLTGKFLGKHPLVIHRAEHRDLQLLKDSNPAAFLKEFANCKKNVDRYDSYIRDPKKKKDITKNERLRDKHRERMEVFRKILANETDNSL